MKKNEKQYFSLCDKLAAYPNKFQLNQQNWVWQYCCVVVFLSCLIIFYLLVFFSFSLIYLKKCKLWKLALFGCDGLHLSVTEFPVKDEVQRAACCVIQIELQMPKSFLSSGAGNISDCYCRSERPLKYGLLTLFIHKECKDMTHQMYETINPNSKVIESLWYYIKSNKVKYCIVKHYSNTWLINLVKETARMCRLF